MLIQVEDEEEVVDYALPPIADPDLLPPVDEDAGVAGPPSTAPLVDTEPGDGFGPIFGPPDASSPTDVKFCIDEDDVDCMGTILCLCRRAESASLYSTGSNSWVSVSELLGLLGIFFSTVDTLPIFCVVQ